MTGPAIVVEHLSKRYGAVQAVDDASFTVRPGEVFALLGPNGAGKTTTVEILAGHRRRSAGVVRVAGFDPERGGRAFRERVAIVLQSGGFDEDLTVLETVSLYAGLYGGGRTVDDVVDAVGLADKRRARVRTLSGGQRRRLELALAVTGDPEVLFLDEPTTGFDPEARHRAWDLLRSLRGAGTTVLLTSHYMDEVQALADRIAVLSAGRIVAEATPAALGHRDQAESVIRLRSRGPWWEAALPAGPWRVTAGGGDELELRTDRPTEALYLLTSWARERGEELAGLAVSGPSLEDVYLSITAQPEPAP